MAIFRARLTIEIERADGSRSVMTETIEHSGGDNPAFEHSGVEEAAHRAMRAVLQRVPTPAALDA